jgi:2-C-methyl-D-erythritol 2,4-cyclodiphosphate synthase
MNRVGIGYDVHRLVEGRKLVLGGVEIAHTHGLEGHSDADVLSHAIADAVLGAVGERDIGFHFPNSDPGIKGISSLKILEEVCRILRRREATVANVDATLIAEAPKIGPHVAEMQAKIASALSVPRDRIGIKATTNESIGFIGRGEGIAAMAVASVIQL